jgi:hypothetical protein
MLVNKKLEAAPGFEDLNNELAKLKLGMVSLVEAVQKVDYADHAPEHRPVRSYESNDLRSINFRRRSQCFAVWITTRCSMVVLGGLYVEAFIGTTWRAEVAKFLRTNRIPPMSQSFSYNWATRR